MRTLLFFLVLTLSGTALAAPPAAFEVISAEFGIFDASDPQETVFEPTLVVPHREGQRYGWMIELRTKKRSLAVREEYILPTAASESGPTGSLAQNTLSIPLPRRSQVSQRQLVPVGGRIYGEWAVGAGEPPGRRHLQVIIEGELAGSFDYEVK